MRALFTATAIASQTTGRCAFVCCPGGGGRPRFPGRRPPWQQQQQHQPLLGAVCCSVWL